MNPREAVDLVQKMLVAWPRLSMEKEQAAFYAEQIVDLPLEQSMQALVELARSNTFPPSVAEFRGRVADVVRGESAESAWDKVQKAAIEAGSGAIYVGDISQIALGALDDVGGFYRLRMTESPQYMKRDFVEAYGKRAREVVVETGLALDRGERWRELAG